MILLMKTGPYNPIKPGLDKYDSLELLTTQQFDPILDETNIKDFITFDHEMVRGVNIVYTSALQRAKDTASFLQKNDYIPNSTKLVQSELFNELRFNINEMCSQEEYIAEGSTVVRKQLLNKLADNQLIESQSEIHHRVAAAAEFLTKNEEMFGNILCITHTFFFVVLKGYIKNRGLFNDPEDLRSIYDPSQRIMDFMHVEVLNP